MAAIVNTKQFYAEYHGHPVQDLQKIVDKFKSDNSSIVYLAGDSSLDNKFWFNDAGKATNGYQHILDKPVMIKDVSYQLNAILNDSGRNMKVVNCAVEESTLADRDGVNLLDQDYVIQKNVRKEDTVVISIGGNDIALKPSLSTIGNLLLLCHTNSISTIKKGPQACWGMNHFINLFKNGIENYIENLTQNNIPKKVVVCMIYYPDETVTDSWASKTLGYIGYNSDPKKLQEIIRQIYKHAIMKINVPGVNVVPYPMYKVLDGKNTNDYVHRVEPSARGGEKLANALYSFIL